MLGEDEYLRYQEFDRVQALRGRPCGSNALAPDPNAPRSSAPISTAPSSTAPSSTAPSSTAPSSSTPSSTSGLMPSIRRVPSQWEGVDLPGKDARDAAEQLQLQEEGTQQNTRGRGGTRARGGWGRRGRAGLLIAAEAPATEPSQPEGTASRGRASRKTGMRAQKATGRGSRGDVIKRTKVVRVPQSTLNALEYELVGQEPAQGASEVIPATQSARQVIPSTQRSIPVDAGVDEVQQ
jgi:hypothetical protein